MSFASSIRSAVLPLIACSALAACGEDGETPRPEPSESPTPQPTPTPTPTSGTPTTVTVAFDFGNGIDGWLADHVDYRNGQEASIQFVSGIEALPAPLPRRTGFMLASTNRSDDIFMYLSRPVTGLVPNQAYRIDTRVTFATNTPAGCIGAGGDPGASVYVKAGASAELPGRVIDDGGTIRPNFSHGAQAQGGMDLRVIGDYAQTQGGGSCRNGSFQLKTIEGSNGPVVRADRAGRLWLVIGTDSGFEGTTRIYYVDGRVTIVPVAGT